MNRGFEMKTKITMIFLILWLAFACSEKSTEPTVNPEAPQQINDGWETAALESQGLDSDRINWMSNRIRNREFGDIHSMVIARHGKLVFEQYYGEGARNDLHNVYSITKSVASALIGIAIDNGYINSVDQTLEEFFPEYADILAGDSVKKAITLQQLLSMTDGLEWDEWTYAYSDSRNDATRMARRGDWMRFVLDRPVVMQPGSQFVYSSGTSVLLSGIIRNTTEQQTDEFAAQYLFEPMGITEHTWVRQSDGFVNTGWGLNLKSRDIAKFGQLFLNNGQWNNQQIISSQWVQESTASHTNVWEGVDYGYQWWLRRRPEQPGFTPSANDIFHGHGYGGQFVFVIPSLEIVAVFTSGNFNSNETLPIAILYEGIIEAVAD